MQAVSTRPFVLYWKQYMCQMRSGDGLGVHFFRWESFQWPGTRLASWHNTQKLTGTSLNSCCYGIQIRKLANLQLPSG